MNGERIGELLQMGRRRAGLTQDELARILFIDQAIVSKIESNKIPPSYTLVKQWAQATNSTDLIEIDLGGQTAVKKYRQMETLLKEIKSKFEFANLMRIKKGRS